MKLFNQIDSNNPNVAAPFLWSLLKCEHTPDTHHAHNTHHTHHLWTLSNSSHKGGTPKKSENLKWGGGWGGGVMVFAVYKWALFQAKTEARSGAPLAALSQLHSSRFVQANYCWATSLEVWVVRHTNKAAWQRLTMIVHQQWGFIIRSPRWFNLRVTTSDSEISNLDIRPEFQSLQ